MKNICLVLFLLLTGSDLKAQVDTIALEWDANLSTNLQHYVINYGQSKQTNSDPGRFAYENERIVPKNTNAVLITNITFGIWYFSATAVLNNGLESLFSNEVSYTNRNFAPVNLRIIGPTDALDIQASVDGNNWRSLAIVTSTNVPLVLVAQPRQLFRVQPIRLPPLP